VLLPLDDAIIFRDKPLTVEPYAMMTRNRDAAFSGAVDKLLTKVLETDAETLAGQNGLNGKINSLTREAWKRPSSNTALSLF